MNPLIVGLLCTLALQDCTLAHGTSMEAGTQPVITMTPGSWR